MDILKIEATKHTPEICFDPEKNIHTFQGQSYPENTAEIYNPVFSWLKEYFAQLGNQEVIFNIEIIYFNSSSSKVLMDFFDMLEEESVKGKNIIVNWIYDEENESALEYGEEFQEDLESLKFNLIEKESD
ncbi:MAG: DUF1987 domain-containing protein [SAR324 cluster bacterium]|nr:DUF1987 domain-containing protein [SAR324 cluster bacterium]